jgi:hypothetical protein
MTEPFAEYEETHSDDIDIEAEADEAAEDERGAVRALASLAGCPGSQRTHR